MNRDAGMLHTQRLQYLPRLRQYRIAVVRRNPGLHGDLKAATIPRLDHNMEIRADILAKMPSLPRRLGFH